MSYDNTKFHAAFDAWIAQNVELGFGEHYAGELLEDFEEFLYETKMMKRGPGRVVFGKRLGEKGFDKRKYLGLTYWSGLKLLKKRVVQPRRYQKTIDDANQEALDRDMMERHSGLNESPEDRKKSLDKFHKDLEEEEKRHQELEDA
jgi:hypothetical protein